ncbi:MULTISPECIES: hypothetical protein [Staphylococcus]|uniref:hypothetical protein n=1 Tax=Staphylococcus TaxID=1279 RepID=UPI00076AE7A1|nr:MULTISPECIES: hypothetical protein [Staphylococcus]AMG64387.1 hypothetical protein AL501_09030 [Staphylococcus lugdunensis]MCI2814573.1 hypothetical protein [Staphylococcus lugdunensis]MDU0967081.1 hypothetical protein [Staphylococcus lugdunensis]MDU1965491.1 hypothetical protein [Staphylococcus lugdunensis]MDU2322693.1 hypothetical protein [Staphylococcus lugdunensis]
MNQSTFEKLINDYNNLQYKKVNTAIKYSGVFNKVYINIYFDAWDDENYNFQLILHNNKEYYLTNLNIVNGKFSSKYLIKLPRNIKQSILTNHTLDSFHSKIEDIINKNQFYPINYSKDTLMVNTQKFNPPKEEMYIRGLSHKNMTNNMYNWAQTNINISLKTLDLIKHSHLTLIRTNDITKRKKLKVILKKFNII